MVTVEPPDGAVGADRARHDALTWLCRENVLVERMIAIGGLSPYWNSNALPANAGTTDPMFKDWKRSPGRRSYPLDPQRPHARLLAFEDAGTMAWLPLIQGLAVGGFHEVELTDGARMTSPAAGRRRHRRAPPPSGAIRMASTPLRARLCRSHDSCVQDIGLSNLGVARRPRRPNRPGLPRSKPPPVRRALAITRSTRRRTRRSGARPGLRLTTRAPAGRCAAGTVALVERAQARATTLTTSTPSATINGAANEAFSSARHAGHEHRARSGPGMNRRQWTACRTRKSSSATMDFIFGAGDLLTIFVGGPSAAPRRGRWPAVPWRCSER